jgi:hypothetical protein
MKAYGGVDVWISVFFTPALVVGEWSASQPGRFTPRGKTPHALTGRRLGGPQNRSERRGENS